MTLTVIGAPTQRHALSALASGTCRHTRSSSTELKTNATGFHRVRGVVARVGQSQCCIWLDSEGNVALRVDREDLDYFVRQSFYALQGKQITVRGWLYTYSGEVRMQIPHPAAREASTLLARSCPRGAQCRLGRR